MKKLRKLNSLPLQNKIRRKLGNAGFKISENNYLKT